MDDDDGVETYNEPNDIAIEDDEVDDDDILNEKPSTTALTSVPLDEQVFLPDVEIQEGPDESVATFVFHNETHTLGNSLRHILMKNKKVEFCGYTVPHPLEDKMQLRLQTNGFSASDTLMEGLTDLMSITEHIMVTFNERMENFVPTTSDE